MRPIIPEPGEFHGTCRCGAPGCMETTREGKPFCPWHVELAPYPAEILVELARRDEESARLTKGRPVLREAHLVREALLFLRIKGYSGRMFARALDIPYDAACTLIVLLGRWKLAKVGHTERGDLFVIGVRDPDLPVSFLE